MGVQVYKIARLSDLQIDSALREIAGQVGEFSLQFQSFDSIVGNAAYPTGDNRSVEHLLRQDSEPIHHFGGSIAGVNVAYYRGGNSSEKSPVFDDLHLNVNGVDDPRVRASAVILKSFRPVAIPRLNDTSGLLEAQRAIQESTFSRLQLLQEELARDSIALRQQLDERATAKEKILDEAFAERQKGLDDLLRQRTDSLQAQEEALERRRKEVDDSDNTHARRQIRERMLMDVQDRMQSFGVSASTAEKRRPVKWAMWGLIALLAATAVFTVFELSALRGELARSAAVFALDSRPTMSGGSVLPALSPSVAASSIEMDRLAAGAASALTGERIALWIRLSVVSFGLIASIIYYIRWQNHWAEQHTVSEFALQQFQVDVNRANWVIESCLEWRKETDSPIPSQLLDSITKGLFEGRDQPDQVLHPADELASALLGTASKLTLDVAGNKLEIDKPGKIPKTIKP